MTAIDRGEFDTIRRVLSSADVEEPLTASEIVELLDEHGEEPPSTHRVATVLGREAESGRVEVVGEDPPYRYRLG